MLHRADFESGLSHIGYFFLQGGGGGVQCEQLFKNSDCNRSKLSRSEGWNPLRWKKIFRSEHLDLVHQTLSANHSGTMAEWVNDLLQFFTVAVHTVRDSRVRENERHYAITFLCALHLRVISTMH